MALCVNNQSIFCFIIYCLNISLSLNSFAIIWLLIYEVLLVKCTHTRSQETVFIKASTHRVKSDKNDNPSQTKPSLDYRRSTATNDRPTDALQWSTLVYTFDIT